jgi:glycerophosphoryl diester phosphodiesterase
MKPFFDAPLPIVFAHRGASGYRPENTVPAFEEAIAQGTRYIETDVRLTKDSIPIIFHDSTLLRTGGVKKNVRDLTFAELQRIDVGALFTPDQGKTFPFRGKGITAVSLEEALARFPEVRFNIEMKDGSAFLAEKTVAVVKRMKAHDRVLLASMKRDAVIYVREHAPAIATSACRIEVLRSLIGSYHGGGTPADVPFDAFQVPPSQYGITVANKRFIDAAKARGIPFQVWTVNDEGEIRRLLDLGVDGIFSDFPDRALAIARRYR